MGIREVMLLLNYFGQGAWLLNRAGTTLNDYNPFYGLVPAWFLIPSIAIATGAAIVASQALISGSFTLINEAIRLNFWPKVRIVYPTTIRGQLYIPSVNWMLWAGCLGITLYFQESSGMEAAYGLAIIITMLSTTTLLSYYLYLRRRSITLIVLTLLLFLVVESSFLVAKPRQVPAWRLADNADCLAAYLTDEFMVSGKKDPQPLC